ncbi:nicotinate phosphoribosyltransferase [Aquipuribacter hungaricus]|uniref:Nicotinate phosphoribosyltransferase n=1 Tax=Aquipuribacter hungaricus TaxID=545624 RepID=A0ABV7WJS0_9MICO
MLALATDRYELTMLQAALADGTASRRCVFEVFARRLPGGRRFGLVAGQHRVLEVLQGLRWGEEEIGFLRREGVVDAATADWLAGYRFDGDVDGYADGEVFVPGSPLLTVRASFATAVLLETVVLSILNHDCAVAGAAARMVLAAEGRPLIEMGSRRAHEDAAVDAARAAHVAGFASTSNLAAGARHGVPTAGTSAHAFTLLHDDERSAFAAQVAAMGVGTTLLVDTYDITEGIRTAVEVAGPGLGAVRIDSGDLASHARFARRQLDDLGATGTRVVVSGDLDEHGIARLSGAPVDAMGVGTSVVTGSGAPTAGLVYKLVEVDGRPVAKRSAGKATHAGAHAVVRRHRPSGVATEEVLVTGAAVAHLAAEPGDECPAVPLVRGGEPTAASADAVDLAASRARAADRLGRLPWEGLSLAPGDPAFPTTYRGPS